jgi:hypothetical protein
MSTFQCSMAATLFTLMGLLYIAPCGAGEELASVQGTVSLNGKPLPSGKIIFHLGDGQFVGAKIKEDGTFKVDRLPPGTHAVTIESTQKTPKGDVKNLLPPKYSSEEHSGLRLEVKKGMNTCQVDIQAK